MAVAANHKPFVLLSREMYMNSDALRLAFIVGVLQGVFEWLPISSEGNVSLYLTVVEGLPAEAAVRYSLFLHAGTGLAAILYYRGDVMTLVRGLPRWRPAHAFDSRDRAETTFLAAATVVSATVGVSAFLALEALVSRVSGGVFVALVGALLILTGIIQRAAEGSLGGRETPTAIDAVLIGGLQGLAILPGVSRSGTTVSALLLRGYTGPAAFRLSFLLSIPAALGAGLLALLDTGLPSVGPVAAAVALGTSAVVGYVTIDGLLRVVDQVAFWLVCVGLGGLAVIGGLLVVL
jgi:undecaprenyl-diphosphatase